MNIALRLDANNEIGMGHAVRMSALVEALAERGCECVYFCRENPEIREFTAEHGIGFTTVPVMELAEELLWMRDVLSGFDAVIIDSYFVSDSYIDALNRPGFTVVCYDDNTLYEYSCDAVLNGNLHALELDFRFGRKKPEMLLGGKYTLLRREFRIAEPIEIREQAARVFVCFGGSDVRNFTPAVIYALCDIPNIEIVAVLGVVTVCDDKVYALAGENVRVYKNPPSLSELMRECDIAVTAGGSTVYELAALGIPSLVVVQVDNQELIAEFLDRNGLMKCVGDWQTADLSILKREVQLLLDNPARRKIESEALKHAVSRSGAENAVERLIEMMAVKSKNVGS